jgi:hypothetical protein
MGILHLGGLTFGGMYETIAAEHVATIQSIPVIPLIQAVFSLIHNFVCAYPHTPKRDFF